jgi:MscS family membrane protein
MRSRFRIVQLQLNLALVTAGLALTLPVLAQQLQPKPTPDAKGDQAAQAAAPAPEKVPEDPLGRSTPHGTVVGFLNAADNEDYERAAEYLDSKQPSRKKEELARQLKLIMDRALSVNLDTLSRQPEGEVEGKLRNTRELVGVAAIGEDKLDILLDRIQRGKNPPIWLFSAETLLSVPQLAEELEPAWVERYTPKVLLQNRLLSLPLYRWVGGLIAIPLLLIVAWLFTHILRFCLRPILHRLTKERGPVPDIGLAGPTRLLILALLIRLGSTLGVSLSARQFWTRVATVLAVLALVWLYMRLTDAVAVVVTRRFRRSNLSGRIAVVQLLQGLSKVVALIAALLIILYMAGVNLTAVVTGLGVGGVAIAFAAQKTIENLFGTAMVVTDRVVRVGDFCRIGNSLGTIEDVGLRSTRLRTLSRTVVNVPNGQLAAMSLENFGPRDRILFNHTIGIRYQTKPDQLRYILREIRRLLYEHPKIETVSARIRFVRFGGSSLDLEVFAYVLTTEFPVFLEIQEELLLRIMDIVEASGSSVAVPSQVVYIGRDSGLDAEKSEAAPAEVSRRLKEQQLP